MPSFSLTDLPPQHTAVVRGTVPLAALPAFLQHAFGAVMQALASHHLAPAGEPFAYYHGAPTTTVDVEAGCPVAQPWTASGDVTPSQLPGGRVAMALHIGPYETMVETYHQLTDWMASQHLAPAESMWEVYLSDPRAEPDPATWQTRIYWPVQPLPSPAENSAP
jgi:effector-binding domain-containing protein